MLSYIQTLSASTAIRATDSNVLTQAGGNPRDRQQSEKGDSRPGCYAKGTKNTELGIPFLLKVDRRSMLSLGKTNRRAPGGAG